MAISSNVFLVFGIHCNGREGRDRGGEFSRFLFSAPVDYLGHNSKNCPWRNYFNFHRIIQTLKDCKNPWASKFKSSNKVMMALSIFQTTPVIIFRWRSAVLPMCHLQLVFVFWLPREGVRRAEEEKNCLYLAARGPTSLSNGQRLIHHSALIVCYSWKLMFWKNK